jgi:nitric oxide reductase NorQ protein
MAKVTNHTVFARVTSHGSGGRADIFVGHPALETGFSDPFLTNLRFRDFPVGTFVVAKVRLSGRRRQTKLVRIDDDAKSAAQFRMVYKAELDNEARLYDRAHGGMSAESVKTFGEPSESTITSTPVSVDEWENRIYIDPMDDKLFNTMKHLTNKRHVAVLMIGPSGYGKTSVPEQKAKDWDMDFLRWDCATVRDPEEFFGFRGAIDGSTMDDEGDTIFKPSRFTEKVENGNVVVVLDELNRIDPYISNILFPLLDHAGQTSVAGHDIVVGDNVLFVATINQGFQFTGTFQMDTALTNRFTAKVLVRALPQHIEEKVLVARGNINTTDAKKIVALMTKLRSLNEKGELSLDASTRVSIQVAELVGCGLTIKEALLYVVVNGVSEDEGKMVVDQIGMLS